MSTTVTGGKERRVKRFSLTLPSRIEVRVDDENSWNEVTRLGDVSGFGAAFVLKRPVKRGRILLVSSPMPRQLRCFDYLEPQYRVWALVRHCQAIDDDPATTSYAIGIAFIGKYPPQGYLENPSKLYELSTREDDKLWPVTEAEANPDESDLPIHLRRHSRFSIPEPLLLELLDEHGDVAASEVSVTENLSLGGAAIFTSFDVKIGSFFRVKSERFGISIISIVRGKRVGSDGIVRLHLEFVDHLFPLEGIE